MKTISVIVSIIVIAVVMVACTGNPPSTTAMYVLSDITDEHLSKPDTGQVIDLFKLDENSESGGEFRLTDITDVSLNKVKEITLKAAGRWLSNEFAREEEIKRFEEGVKKIITEANNSDYNSKPASSIYIPIVLELARLKESPADRKILLVYSDLMENTQELSYYRKGDFDRLEQDPESIKKQLEKMMSIDTLSGLEIFFIYQPPDTKSDERYRKVSGLYKEMFEAKGARVTISADIN